MKFREAYSDIELYEPGRLPIDVDLSDNTNLFGVAPSVRGLLNELANDLVTRYPSVFAKALKQKLADLHGVAPANIATGCGSDDLIDSTVRAFCEPGDKLVYPWPTFGVVSTFARMNATQPVPVVMGNGFVPASSAMIREAGAVTYLCSPNNPTGNITPDAEITALENDLDGLLLLDEAYSQYSQTDYAQFAASSKRTVSLRTFSKAYGLAGLRVGYCIGPAPIVHEIEKSRGPYKVGGVAEAAAVAVLSSDGEWVTDKVRKTLENRDRLAAELAGFPVRVYPSQANFLLLGLPDGASAVGINAALRTHGVAVRPFTDLALAGEALRVTAGPWEMMQKFLDALDAVLRA